jgi:hypothetical protein
VPSELGYGYFCDNIVGEDDAWVSSHKRGIVILCFVIDCFAAGVSTV